MGGKIAKITMKLKPNKVTHIVFAMVFAVSSMMCSPVYADAYTNLIYDFDRSGTSIMSTYNGDNSAFNYNYLVGEWSYNDGGNQNSAINAKDKHALYPQNSISFEGSIGGKQACDKALILKTQNLTYNSSMESAYTPSFTWQTVNYVLNGKFVFDFDFYYAGNGQRYQIKLGYLNSSNSEIQKDINIKSDGSIDFLGKIYSSAISQEKWYNITLISNLEGGIVTIYIDGKELGSTELGNSDITGLKRIKFETRYQNSSSIVSNGCLAIDNMRLYTKDYAGSLSASLLDPEKAVIDNGARAINLLSGMTVAEANGAISSNGNSIRFYRDRIRLSHETVLADNDYAIISNNLNSTRYYIKPVDYIPKVEISKKFLSVMSMGRATMTEDDEALINPKGDVAYKFTGEQTTESNVYYYFQANLNDIEHSANPSAYVMSFKYAPNTTISHINLAMQSSKALTDIIRTSDLNANEWNDIKIIYYTNTLTSSLYINNEFVSDYTAESAPTLFRVCIYRNTSTSTSLNNCYCYFDDIVLEEYTLESWSLVSANYKTNGVVSANKFNPGTFEVKTSINMNQSTVSPTLLTAQYNGGTLVKTDIDTTQIEGTGSLTISTSVSDSITKIEVFLGENIIEPNENYLIATLLPYSTTSIENFEKVYPSYSTKALTLTFDDGKPADERLISILNDAGIKATFFLPSSIYPKAGDNNYEAEAERLRNLYAGHEVANHSKNHLYLYYTDNITVNGVTYPLSYERVISEIADGKSELEAIFQKDITGFAWPVKAATGRSDYGDIVKYLKETTKYVRTNNGMSNSYAIPTDWYNLCPTCHVAGMPAYIDLFINEPDYGKLKYFYTYGHSWEFDAAADDSASGWTYIENMVSKLKSTDDIWFATTSEVVDYTSAIDKLYQEQNTVYNPTEIDLYVRINGQNICIPKGSSYTFGN